MKNINENSRKGQENIAKMKSLMGRMSINENKKPSTVELTKLGPDNVVYGIVKENKDYYIKTSEKINNVLLEDFKYIGGLSNKRDYAFESYSQALKKLNLKMISLNEAYEGDNVNVFKNDNLFVENVQEEEVENEFIEEMVGDKCDCGADTYCNASGKDCPVKDDTTIDEGELEVGKVKTDGPKTLDGNSVGEFKDVTAEPDDAPNDNSTGTVKDTIKETSKGLKILDVLARFDSVVESVLDKKKSLNEAKYKLKVDDPTPTPEPQGVNVDAGSLPQEPAVAPEAAAEPEENPFEDTPFDAGVEADEDSDPKKFIQQLSGKLAQSIRTYTQDIGIDLELEKFAINSIISATHTSQMDEEDQGDIIKKIKSSGNEAEDDVEGDEPVMDDDSAPDMGSTNPAAPAPMGSQMGENIEVLPKEHKQVFKNAKLGVNESVDIQSINVLAKKYGRMNPELGKELNYYAFSCDLKDMQPDMETVDMILAGHGKGKSVDKYSEVMENDDVHDSFANIDDLEKMNREVEYQQPTHDYLGEDEGMSTPEQEIELMAKNALRRQPIEEEEPVRQDDPAVSARPGRKSRPYKVRTNSNKGI